MAVQRKKLRVLPNPWLHIDEKGRPAGTVRLEQPGNGTAIHGWVGARVTKVTEIEPPKRVKVEGRVFEQKHGIHDLEFGHAVEPVTIDNTPYYRKRVASGDLIAFDEATAQACGISKTNFVKPELLLEQIKEAAIKQFDAENGEGAFEALADIAKEEAEIAEAVAKSVAEANGEQPAETSAEASEAPAPELAGLTLPANGSEVTAELTAIEGATPLAEIKSDENGNAEMTEHTAPARSKRKGSDQ